MKSVTFLFILLFSLPVLSKSLSFYLPQEEFDPNIPTPESVLGYQVGEWHVRHDQLVSYMRLLAEKSERIKIKQIGFSHERRPLLQLFITSPSNQAQLDTIQNQHIATINGERELKSADPIIVNLNYSVHGDESSGSNASLLVAYYLAASQNPKVADYLANMVVILDPSLNPDGLSRFAQWANQFKGQNLVADSNHIEHIQGWTRGRVNHYWFDLNRDWLLLQHPESQARIKQFHAWRPTVLTDHHEMGTDSTFFFQPGIASRKNPFTPDENVELTMKLAQFQAKAFDDASSLYFTEEAFDDFYAGKGSTYPDLNGTIGILYEQASSRGHAQESINGLLEFPSTIKNQVTASLAALEGSRAHKEELLRYQSEFNSKALEQAKQDNVEGYLVDEQYDKNKLSKLIAILNQHNIQFQGLSKTVTVEGNTYTPESSIFIPTKQPQYRLIRSLFSEQKSFNDNTFYDVSSWNIAMAFDLTYAKVLNSKQVRGAITHFKAATLMHALELSEQAVAYAIDWRDSHAPKLAYRLLEEGVDVRVAMKPFSAKTTQGVVDYPAGTLIVNKGLQNGSDWFDKMSELAVQFNVNVNSIGTGLTPTGIDLGSRNMKPLTKPNVLMVGGKAASLYEAGEAWFFMDKDLGFSPTIIEADRLKYIDLNKYTHVVMVDGRYSQISKSVKDDLEQWIKKGGVLWAQKQAMSWVVDNNWLKADYMAKSDWEKPFEDLSLAYEDKEALAGRKRVAGAFFNAQIDLSHPIAFGLTNSGITLFKNRSSLVVDFKEAFTQVASYKKDDVLASGYADEVNQKHIATTAAIIAHRFGQGSVIGMVDNPNFRAYTKGAQRFFINALFLGHTLSY